LVIALSALLTEQFSYRRMPTITGASSDHLVIIGDSISAGLDTRVPTWPVVFQNVTGILTKNLSKPGVQTSEGPAMADKVTLDDHVVLVEVGGNDLLSGISSVVFERNLDATLSKLAMPGRTTVMFELPLLPNKTAYGRVQRRLAAKYRVWLIPKRFPVDIIGAADATSDGLHLSEVGAHRMAVLVAKTLAAVLRPNLARKNGQ
jgi:acyl-CoA thioesterase I